MTEINKQERTNRDPGLDAIMESMYTERCGRVHASAKRKKKVKEADDPNVKKRTPALFGRADDQDKKVQWTKDIKAKLAKAQEIGDSKEANKLQRFLDTHGVDEAYVKEATKCDHCDGKGWHQQEEYPFAKKKCDRCGGDGELDAAGDRDDPGVVKEAGDPAQNTAGYIQIDLYTGGVQTISPESVNQAIEGLKHVPAGEGESDWDAWTGEEYMIVAVPKTVHWPQTGTGGAADAPAPTGPISSPSRLSQSPHRPGGMAGPGMMP